MMVCGLNLPASTMRNRNCPSLHRAPAPARSGAMVPWNLSCGNGPECHSRHSPVLWSATIARPRAASPWLPVSDAGMASPTILYCTRSAFAGTAKMASAAKAALAENLGRRGAEPGIGILGVLGAQRGRRIKRAGVDRVVDFGVLAVHRVEFAGDRNGVAGRDDAVAIARHWGCLRRGAGEEAYDRGGAEPAFDQAGERRLRHGAGEGRVADDVDVLLFQRFERHRIDRAPAGAVDDAGQACDLAGF